MEDKKTALAELLDGPAPAKVYLAGPVTTGIGSVGEARARFAAARRLAQKAWPEADIVDPTCLNPDPEVARREAMTKCFQVLLSMGEGDLVLLLPGWRGSSGAGAEAVVAGQLALRALELPTSLMGLRSDAGRNRAREGGAP